MAANRIMFNLIFDIQEPFPAAAGVIPSRSARNASLCSKDHSTPSIFSVMSSVLKSPSLIKNIHPVNHIHALQLIAEVLHWELPSSSFASSSQSKRLNQLAHLGSHEVECCWAEPAQVGFRPGGFGSTVDVDTEVFAPGNQLVMVGRKAAKRSDEQVVRELEEPGNEFEN
jgi:hypothetical protein